MWRHERPDMRVLRYERGEREKTIDESINKYIYIV